jgi:Rod binding domain-containing protein
MTPITETPLPISQELTLPSKASSKPAVFRNMIRQLGGDPGPVNQTRSQLADRLAETGAKRMMADAFLVPLLKEVRESTQPQGIFAPGTGEKRFGMMLDQAIADQILDSKNFPLGDALVEKLRMSFQRVADVGSKSEEVHS